MQLAKQLIPANPVVSNLSDAVAKALGPFRLPRATTARMLSPKGGVVIQGSLFDDLEMQDPVPWDDVTDGILRDITAAPWKSVDLETTGLTPTSEEQTFGAKELATGIDPSLRIRVVAIVIPDGRGGVRKLGFDLDLLPGDQRQAIARACLSKTIIGHNVGFDLYWLSEYAGEGFAPDRVIDTMVIGRALRPEVPLIQAKMVTDSSLPEDLRQNASEIFTQDRSGWSLSDLALALLRRPLDKSLQGPKNWCKRTLTLADYEYGTGDAVTTLEVLRQILGCVAGEDVLKKYEDVRSNSSVMRLVEPQVPDVVRMRSKGMPWKVEQASKYVSSQQAKVKAFVEKLLMMEPTLAPWRGNIESMTDGIKADLKKAVGQAFQSRGLVLETTAKSGDLKIGEKDLRRARAQQIPEAMELFTTWVGIQKAKKAANMALDFCSYAQRSGDGCIHSLMGPGPVTGRLAAAEPNVQQCPGDKGFRECVAANDGHFMTAADYSALDMRVGAALAVRAQVRIQEAFEGKRDVEPDLLECIKRVKTDAVSLEDAIREEAEAVTAFKRFKDKRDEVSRVHDASQLYWHRYRALQRKALLARFTRCLAFVQTKARAAGTPEWSSLRDAFDVPNMDIHTWTALSMTGRDPSALFRGMTNEQIAEGLSGYKKELGDIRKTGKVGNLSLLYAMQTYGLQEAAAKNYDIHWTYEEADKVRNDWLASYVEVDLWHAWTELTPYTVVNVPDSDKGGRMAKKTVYSSQTLGGRTIYAFSLNAALSYEDQSTGADILGTVMHELSDNYPEIFACIVNQIHDEVLFEIPDYLTEEYEATIARVMSECAERFTMQYGVHCEASPATGYSWLKDPLDVPVHLNFKRSQPEQAQRMSRKP